MNTLRSDVNIAEGVGIIVPPLEVKEILETTAKFVGKRPALEARVLQQHDQDPRFSFLQPADPYHAYYRAKVAEARQTTAAEKHASRGGDNALDGRVNGMQNGTIERGDENGGLEKYSESTGKKGEQSEDEGGEAGDSEGNTTKGKAFVSYLKSFRAKEEASRPEPHQPPPDDLFTLIYTNPPPYALALDVIKLTAQFAARHGRNFVAALAAKEARNNLFDFLKPLHPHFIVFQRLVDAYTAILDIGEQKERLLAEVHNHARSEKAITDTVWYMHDWDCLQAEREHEAAMDESEKLKAAQIDWHDFVILATVDFDENEGSLPAPVADAKQLPKILAAAEKAQQEREKNKENVDMDIDQSTEFQPSKPPRAEVPASQVSTIADIPAARIRTQPGAEEVVVPTPATEAKVTLPSGQQVPLSQVEASVRAELLDPSYKDERARAAEKNRLQNLAGGEEMARNLARWEQARAESSVYNRADLQEALMGRAKPVDDSEVERKLGKAVASGPHLPENRENEELSQPAKKARVEAAVDALSKAKKDVVEENVEEEGKEEEKVVIAGLVSGAEWIAKQGATAVVRIRVPVHAGKEWKLQGQEIEMSATLKSSVTKLKAVVAKYTKLPAKKQKLMIEGVGFLKDGLSLADYNVGDGTVMVLEVKERGGRRRHH